MSKTKEVMSVPSAELLAELRENTPVEAGYTRIQLPRLGFYSQDQTEGKGKQMVVTAEAGTFYTEVKVGEDYVKTEIGKDVELTIAYYRKKLSYYDQGTEKFTSSSLYDNDDDIVSLFQEGKKIATGKPQELRAQAVYQKMGEDGKVKSKLEENRVLYVIYNDEPHELTIRGSSMWSFSSYSKSLLVTSVLTNITSTAEQKGTIEWNKMAFSKVRDLSAEEVMTVVGLQRQIKEGIAQEKSYFTEKVDTVPVISISAPTKLEDF